MSSSSSNQNKPKTSGLVHQPFPEHEINIFNPPKSNPNGYLIKSQPKSTRNATLPISSPLPNNWMERPVNPWIISSMLIVLLTNIIAGIIIYIYQSNSETKLAQNKSSNFIASPNLSAEEFIDLKTTSLSNIVLPQTKKNNYPKQISPLQSQLTPLAIPPTNIPNYVPGVTSTVHSNYYYILTEYTGEESLALAKQKVANLSLVNFPQGVFIYLGAFTAKNQAQQFIAQLKEEGINAYIYPFE